MLITKELADLVRQDWARLGRNRRSLGLIADLHGTSKETIALILDLDLSEEDKRRARKGLPAVKPPRKGRKVIDYERMDELILEGARSCREIAADLGVCRSTVENRAKALRRFSASEDVNPTFRTVNGKKHYIRAERLAAVQRYYAGEKQTDIARDLGVSSVTVCMWIKRYKEGEL